MQIKDFKQALRERVLNYLDENGDKKNACELFKISLSTIYRLLLRKAQTGNIKPFRRKYAYKKIDDNLLLEYIKKHPDHFLKEIGAYFSLTPQTIFYALRRLKIKRKKKLLSIRREMKIKEKFSCKN